MIFHYWCMAFFKTHTSTLMEVNLHSYHVSSGSILSTLDMKKKICESLTVNSSLVDRMKEYLISNEALHNLSHAFYSLSGENPPPELVYHCFDEERKQDWLLCRYYRDTEHLPPKGFRLPGLRHGHYHWSSQVNQFHLLLNKNTAKLHSPLLIFISNNCSFFEIHELLFWGGGEWKPV